VPISYVMQVKYQDGRTDAFTTHGEYFGSDNMDVIDQRVARLYGFFKNKSNEIILLQQIENWRGGGWYVRAYNLTRKSPPD